jgi:TatA/E family protein of Tat protein translocase
MFGLGFQEIIIILIVALIIIGPRKLPDLAKSLGKAFREFKNATEDIKQNFDLDTITRDETPPLPKQPNPAAAETDKAHTKENT